MKEDELEKKFEIEMAEEYTLSKRDLINIFGAVFCSLTDVDPNDSETICEIRDSSYEVITDVLIAFKIYEKGMEEEIKSLLN